MAAHQPLDRPAPGLALPEDGSTFGTVFDLNLVGLWTLYVKEVRRFLKVITQTVVAPIATTLMFLAIFALALGQTGRTIEGTPFLVFLAPGLIMMAIVQNAFANTSSSIMIAKVQGNIVDYLMPPLSPGELVAGVILGGVTRGLVVGVAVYLAMIPFVALPVSHPFLALGYVLAASLMLSTLGLITALWAEKFDQMAAATNFVITPLSFLSGTFYSIRDLPEPFHALALANPFFYMIDGVRFALTDHADGPIWAGMLILAITNAALLVFAWWLVRTGYRLKA
ncbi:MAG TPA: ABC transporter permease [Geminicoccaceae bacterium]|nr:ABC transporter permease [Geminicoccaceae bacterium]